MNVVGFARYRDRLAAVAAIAGPLLVTAILVPLRSSFANTDVALVLVAVIVAVAANGDRLAGVLAAVSAAVWFDFFFTKPYDQLSITRRADVETTVLLLIIGVAVTELAVRGRRQQAAASRRAGYLAGLHSVAGSVAVGDSGSEVTRRVTDELVRLLTLSSCRFQAGVAGLGKPARMDHEGEITIGTQPWDTDDLGLPQDQDIELLAENNGILVGRFMMTAAPGSRPSLERRLVAAALADQVGAALAHRDSVAA
jgi:K+-sensing histidine kinase KdpD